MTPLSGPFADMSDADRDRVLAWCARHDWGTRVTFGRKGRVLLVTTPEGEALPFRTWDALRLWADC